MKLFVKERMEAQNEIIVIISAERSEHSYEINNGRTDELRGMLIRNSDIRFSEAEGCYESQREKSFVCVCNSESTAHNLIWTGCHYFGQECVLMRDASGVSLYYADNRVQKIGERLKAVSECEARNEFAYTHVNGQFFVVK